jgi:hypothetical protein
MLFSVILNLPRRSVALSEGWIQDPDENSISLATLDDLEK